MKSFLKSMVSNNETILWSSKPNKTCYILESIFNPFLPFALMWFIFDMVFVFLMSMGKTLDVFSMVFIAIHLMPVYVYIAGILFVSRKYKNTEYLITDAGVYVSGGLFSYHCEMKPFTEISHITVHRGIFDQYLGVGDVLLSYPSKIKSGSQNLAIEDIRDYQHVFSMLKKLQTDIYSDTMYPNALRPEENPGYRTKYRPKNF